MLLDHHLQELLDSGIDEELTRLNFQSLEGQDAADSLRYALPHSERRNDGRLRDKWIKRYEFAEKGGWFLATLDLANGYLDQWGCFKADEPRIAGGFGEKRKVIKYEHPTQTPTKVFFLLITLKIWQKVSKRHKIAMPEQIPTDDLGRSLAFWRWVEEHPEITRHLVEGGKKAGALFSHGYVAIALPGINMACIKGQAILKPELQPFVTNGAKVNICFDSDSKRSTRRNVDQAILKLGRICRLPGAEVTVSGWSPLLGKGIDDVLLNQGAEAVEEILDNPLTFDTWKTQQLSQLTWKVDHLLNARYLGNFSPPQNSRLICIKSPKGTGKSVWLETQVQAAFDRGERVIVLTHRVRLGEELCNRFGLPYVTELKDSEEGSLLGFGLCIDSLHENSQAHFKPEDWEGCTVILDEAAQFFRHLCNSGTLKKNRVTIMG